MQQMRSEVEAEAVGQVGDLGPFGDAAAAPDIGLDKGNRPALAQIAETPTEIDVLAGGDGDGAGGGDVFEIKRLIGQDRFFQPFDVEIGQPLGRGNGLAQNIGRWIAGGTEQKARAHFGAIKCEARAALSWIMYFRFIEHYPP